MLRYLQAAAAAMVLLAPAAADAATELGQLAPAGTPEGNTNDVMWMQQVAAGNPYVVPAGGGVITSWSHRAGPSGGLLKLKVYRGSGDVYTVVGSSELEGATPSAVSTFATRVPVAAGDRLGLFTDSGQMIGSFAAPSSLMRTAPGERAVGGTVNFATCCGPGQPDARVNVTARLEPDTDSDGFGDETQDDDDGDGAFRAFDNCPTPNPDQANTDGDSAGDACDDDDDNDGLSDGSDNCRVDANADQVNTDGDGQGDACDADDDNDGVADASDNCRLTANVDQLDIDGDAVGDACDSLVDLPGPPRVRSLEFSETAFSAARSGGSIAAVGTRVTYRLSEPATMRFRVERRRGRRYRRMRGTFRHQGLLAANTFTFTGRLRGRRLRPGRYRLVATATDAAGNRSRPRRARFRIVP